MVELELVELELDDVLVLLDVLDVELELDVVELEELVVLEVVEVANAEFNTFQVAV